jgi:hypothetical protein
MSKFVGYDKYCMIDLNNKTSNCGDKYVELTRNCTKVNDTIKTFYEPKTSTPLENETLKIARDPTIDYNYFRAGR